jgi:hypothetical protein
VIAMLYIIVAIVIMKDVMALSFKQLLRPQYQFNNRMSVVAGLSR